MEKSFYDIYMDICKNENKWCYYQNPPFKMDICHAWDNKKSANGFIHSYFAAGGKSVFDISNIGYLGSSHKRDIHTVSVFLLGIKIAETVGKTLSHNELFIWFLMCLYHDIGYRVEEDKSLMKKVATLDKFLEVIKIGPNSNIFTGLKSKTLCKNYYRYIKDKLGHIDHGIVGGIMLYDKLVKNYDLVRNYYQNTEQFCQLQNGDYEYKGLFFSETLFPEYQKAAESIIKHNMWYAKTDEEKDTYKEYHLENLILQNNQSISLSDDNKLFFLLCLADTIEPLKRYAGIESEYVLKNIEFKAVEGGFELRILCNYFKVEEYFEGITSLQDWLNVTVDVDKNSNKLSIVIDQ